MSVHDVVGQRLRRDQGEGRDEESILRATAVRSAQQLERYQAIRLKDHPNRYVGSRTCAVQIDRTRLRERCAVGGSRRKRVRGC